MLGGGGGSDNENCPKLERSGDHPRPPSDQTWRGPEGPALVLAL